MEDKKFKRLEKQLIKLDKKLIRLKEAEASPNVLNSYKIKISELNNEINGLCVTHLEHSSREFREIAVKSYESIQVSNLTFKPYKEEMSYVGSYAKTLYGKLNNNGHIYCNTRTINNWLINPFAQYLFPSEFSGKIDCLGNINLKASKVAAAFVNRLPSEFNASISSMGVIKLTTTKTENDFLTRGKILISKIIGQYTFKDKESADFFFENKKTLLALVNEYRMNVGIVNKTH